MSWLTVIKPYVKRKKSFCVLSVFLVVAEVVLGSLQPRLVAKIIDIGIQQNCIDYILRTGAKMLVICVVGYVVGIVATIISGKLSAEIGQDIRNDLFSKILHANMQETHNIKKQSLFNIISGDCNTVMEFLAELIHTLIKPVSLFASGIVMLFLINPAFSWVMLASIVVEVLIMIYLYKKTSKIFAIIRIKIDTLIKILRQNIIGARLIKIFSREEKERVRFYEQNKIIENESLAVWRFSAKINSIIMIVMNSVILLILLLGGMQAKQHFLQTGEILASITYSQQIMMSIMSFGIFFRYLAEANVAIERIKNILQLDYEKLNTQIELEAEIEEITFKNVSFKYEQNYKLDNISFTLKKGDVVGLFGETASGKTLLIDILTGLYPAYSGEILINGKNIYQFTPESLRSHIAVALQEEGIFSESIEENITWGRAGDLQRSVEMGEAKDFIDHAPNKFKTFLYDKGSNLSGGERQRLQMARAFLSNAEVLIVDDAISQIDGTRKKHILDNVTKDPNRNIVILSSQRPSLLKNCNKIIVIKDGKILATGNHDSLALTCDLYRTFCDLQRGGIYETQ